MRAALFLFSICIFSYLSAFYERAVTAREIILDTLEAESAFRSYDFDRKSFPLENISFREPLLNTDYHTKIWKYLSGECPLNDLNITSINFKLWLYAAKDIDLFFRLHPDRSPLMHTTFALRYCCLTTSRQAGCPIETTEAFSINNDQKIFEYHDEAGNVINAKRNNLINQSRSLLLYIPEWANRLQKALELNIKGFFELNKTTDPQNPKIILIRGATGCGKSFQLNHHSLLLPYALHLQEHRCGIFATDNLKALFLKFWTDMTHAEIHINFAGLNQELCSIAYAAYPDFTFILEGWFRRFSLIQEILDTVKNQPKTKIEILDIDTPLKICSFRILFRANDKICEKPKFKLAVYAYDEIRRMRLDLIQQVMLSDKCSYYELITGAFRDKNQILIAWKIDKGLMTSPQNLLEFSQALSQYNQTEIEEVAEYVISLSDYIEYGHFLQPFLGMKIKDALNKIAN